MRVIGSVIQHFLQFLRVMARIILAILHRLRHFQLLAYLKTCDFAAVLRHQRIYKPPLGLRGRVLHRAIGEFSYVSPQRVTDAIAHTSRSAASVQPYAILIN